jgi:hypothetical protein
MKKIIWLSLTLLILTSPVSADDKKATMRPTTSESRHYWQFHSDPDPKKSGWTFETDRVYNYEIRGSDHKDSWKEKSNGKRR